MIASVGNCDCSLVVVKGFVVLVAALFVVVFMIVSGCSCDYCYCSG